MTHLHPTLSYQFDALEPHIDAQTMQFHYYKHHQSAVETLNKAIAGTEAENKTLEEILLNVSAYPYARNSAGSHYNHSQYWKILGSAGTQPLGELLTAINNTFGSLNAMQEKVNAAGLARFGSGWAWLIVKNGKLEVTSTPNQDNPLMNTAEVQGTPIIGIDVWEHAYYLKYQNRRADYLNNIWNVINWEEASSRYSDAVK